MRKLVTLLTVVAAVACTSKKEPGYKVPAPQDVVMYQVNPRVFAPQNSLQAVVPQLDSIKALGTNVVWIMPVYPIGKEKSKNSPYSIADYCAINPEFGTLEDFKTLVDECHKRGMAFIMDWVANHTAWDHVWTTTHPDWYTQDADGNIIYPAGTDWTDVADLNYDNHDMRKAMTESMIFWTREAGVDGFRCDVADEVPADFWKEAITALRSTAGRPILMLAEGNDPQTFSGGFDMNYGWDYLSALRDVFCCDSSARRLIATDFKEYDAIPAGKLKLRFTTNHDEATKNSTVGEFGGVPGALAAYVAAVFTDGAALVYGEQEVAFPDRINFFDYVPVDWTSHPEVRAQYKALLKVWKENPTLHLGSPDSFTSDDVLAYAKDGGKYAVIVNVRPEAVTLDVPVVRAGLYKNLLTGADVALGGELTLEPFEYQLLVKAE